MPPTLRPAAGAAAGCPADPPVQWLLLPAAAGRLRLWGRPEPAAECRPGCVELLLRDGRKIAIDCTGVEDVLDVTMAQRSELDYLIYNDPLGYADLILNGNPEEYLKKAAGRLRAKQKQGASTRTHPAKSHRQE